MEGYLIYFIITTICTIALLYGLSRTDQWVKVKTYLGFPFIAVFVLWFTAPVLCAIFLYTQIWNYFDKKKHS